MDDPRIQYEKAIADLFGGKRGPGGTPSDARSAFVGDCLPALELMFSEAIRLQAVDAFVDVLAWHLAVIGTAGGPNSIASVVGLLEWHLGRMAEGDSGKAGRDPAGNPGPQSH